MNLTEFREKEIWNDGYATGYATGHKDFSWHEQQTEATLELLDGLFEEDLHSATGIPIERCKELLEIIREKPNDSPLA